MKGQRGRYFLEAMKALFSKNYKSGVYASFWPLNRPVTGWTKRTQEREKARRLRQMENGQHQGVAHGQEAATVRRALSR